MNYRLRPLTDLIEFVVDNRGRSCPTVADGFPLIATNCVKDKYLHPVFESVRYVDAVTQSTWFRAHPEPNDILFVCKGSPGRVALVPDPVSFCIAQDMVALRANQSVVSPRYLYYLLKLSETRRKIANLHVGTMIPHFKRGDFGKLVLPVLEDISEQHAIAEVLSALDDKIVNGRKLAANSLELADLCYRELRQTSSTTPREIRDLATTVLGGTPSREVQAYWENGDVPWINSGKANEDRILQPSAHITKEALANSAAKMMPEKATVVAITGATLGQVARLEISTSGNQSLVGIWADDPALNNWIYLTLRNSVDELLKRATGAAQQHVNKKDVDAHQIDVLENAGLANFDRKVSPLLDIAAAQDREGLALESLRDAILPGLMNGTLRVRNAESILEEVL